MSNQVIKKALELIVSDIEYDSESKTVDKIAKVLLLAADYAHINVEVNFKKLHSVTPHTTVDQ